MKITQAGLDLIARNEGLRLKAYRDVAGIWTIGYGHTPAKAGQVISAGEALDLLRADVSHAERAVEALVGEVPTTAEQFSAMVSLAFNIGSGAFRGSTVLRRHLAEDRMGAANAFLLWDKAHVDGQLVVLAGLHRRRSEERTLYLSAMTATAG